MSEWEDVITGKRNWLVIEGDADPFVKALPDQVVDCVITDPEYNEDTHKGARGLKDGEVEDIGIDFAHMEDPLIVLDWIRVARRWVTAFCALEQLGDYRRVSKPNRKEGGCWVRSGIWDRYNGSPQFSGDRPGQAAEGIAIMHRPGPMEWNANGKRAIWRFPVESKERYGHKTPKPVSLMLQLILDFTKPGEIILDPRAGDGTTGAACLRSGRRVILIEKDPRAAQICRDRMEAESHGIDLRSAQKGQIGLF